MATTAEILTPTLPWHRLLERTSEVRLQVRAPTWPALLAEAGRALALLLLRGATAGTVAPPRLLAVASTGRGPLLVDWLNEILFVADTRLWVPLEIEVLQASNRHLEVRAQGISLAEAPEAVKAATFQGLRVEEVDGGFQAEVVLDV